MKLHVQIPALNEEKTIAQVIAGIRQATQGLGDVTILVVDDGSGDRTGELARAAGADVIRHPAQRGVGATFRTGIEQATESGADIVVTIDADGQFNPADIAKLVAPIVEGQADFVTATRFADPRMIPEMPGLKRWGNGFMARWISTLTGQRFSDVSCGFRAYARNAYLRLVLLGEFTYTHETFLNLAFAGMRIVEVPVQVRGTREFGDSRVANNLLRYGWQTACIILKTYRDYRPLRFFSGLALTQFVAALIFLTFLITVKITTGKLTPHKWSGFVAAAFAGSGLAFYLIGLVAEMFDRVRVAQQELLFRVRRLEGKLTGGDKNR